MKNIVNCIKCGVSRNINEQEYCSNCGGRELWQRKPEGQKTAFNHLTETLLEWMGRSMFHAGLVVFVLIPLIGALLLYLLSFLFGFHINFNE